MSPSSNLDLDWRIRLAAFDRLRTLRTQGGGVVSSQQISEGFEFEGERIALRNPQKGIWRPRQLGVDGAALSIVTVVPKAGRQRPYDDQVASDANFFVYRYEGDDPDYWTNRALRRAMELERPLIYFYGLTPAVYDPIFPCYIENEDRSELAFHIRAGTDAVRAEALFPQQAMQLQREYATAAVKVRLHQRRFRELVIAAYSERCAVCRLRHRPLLSAAHIIEDRDERGVAEVPNGLSLCGVHHDAYDAYILGINPDYRIEIRRDILEETDGPMLKHGLQEMDGQTIHVPRSDSQKPNREYLQWRHDRFKAA